MMKTLSYSLLGIALTYLFVPTTLAADEKELLSLYLDVVETAVDYFEPLWVDESQRIPNSGFFDFRKYKNWMDEPYATIITISGNGMVQFCYSVLLTETDKQVFGQNQVPRAVLLQRAIQSIRWCCLTSAYVEHPYPYLPGTRADFADGPNWRRRFSWRADEVGWLTMASAKLWNQLDEETKKLVEAVMIGGAPQERLVQTWYPKGQGGNHDQIKQDLSSTMGAAFLFPNRPDAKMYWDIIAGNGIDVVSTMQDFANSALAEGKPISEWAKGWNLYPDYSSDHHGWCNLWYGSDLIFEARSYIEMLSAITGVPVPETFHYDGAGFNGVLEWLKVLCLPEGEPASPHGNEYDAYYGAGLLGYCYGSVMKKDALAAALEWKAAHLLQRQSRAVKMYDYHRNSWAKAAMAYLMHKYRGPGAVPLSASDADRKLLGAYHYRWLQNLIHRSNDKWASFAWGSTSSTRNAAPTYGGGGLCGFVIPTRPDEENPLPLVYCHPQSLIGKIEIAAGDGKLRESAPPDAIYKYSMNDAGFHTAGLVPDPAMDRYYAFHSFADGPCVMMTLFRAKEDLRLTWTGLPVYFYVRDGFSPSRQFFCSQGERALEQEGDYDNAAWWCVNDDLGLAFAGPNRKIKIQRSVGFNWARQASYKDKCDGVFVSPIENQAMKAGEEMFLPVEIYTGASHQSIADVKKDGELYQGFSLMKGWRSLAALDPNHPGRRYLAVTNFYSSGNQAVFDFQFPEGAPVLNEGIMITGKTGKSLFQLSPLESTGEMIELYVETLDGKTVAAKRLSDNRYQFLSSDGGQAKIRLRYRGAAIRAATEHPVYVQYINDWPNKSKEYFDYTFTKEGGVIFEFDNERDNIAPFVEIKDIQAREDGRVAVTVDAQDQSGIQSVELFCDGQKVDAKNAPPFLFTHRPGKGYHTYYAEVIDSSQKQNRRASFKRTVQTNF
ncbi:MAG: Ig-like domain-containing protein [Candidatus Omnitrophota bacterium]